MSKQKDNAVIIGGTAIALGIGLGCLLYRSRKHNGFICACDDVPVPAGYILMSDGKYRLYRAEMSGGGWWYCGNYLAKDRSGLYYIVQVLDDRFNNVAKSIKLEDVLIQIDDIIKGQ